MGLDGLFSKPFRRNAYFLGWTWAKYLLHLKGGIIFHKSLDITALKYQCSSISDHCIWLVVLHSGDGEAPTQGLTHVTLSCILRSHLPQCIIADQGFLLASHAYISQHNHDCLLLITHNYSSLEKTIIFPNLGRNLVIGLCFQWFKINSLKLGNSNTHSCKTGISLLVFICFKRITWHCHQLKQLRKCYSLCCKWKKSVAHKARLEGLYKIMWFECIIFWLWSLYLPDVSFLVRRRVPATTRK